MVAVIRWLAGILVVLGLSYAPEIAQAQAQPPTSSFTPEKSAPKEPAKEAAKPAPAKPTEKNVLQTPAKPATPAPVAKAPPPPAAAPQTPVETRTVPAFVPPGPPPLDEQALRKPVLAVLKAAQLMSAEEDSARWVDAQRCWVWVGMKRDMAWSKYRFAYEGACKQGRAEGQGRLKIEALDAQGKWSVQAETEGLWQNGVPLGDIKDGQSGKLIVGLADRTVLSWVGASLNEEAEVFTVGRADDQGRATPCQAQGVLAVIQADDIGGERFKHLLRRATSVVNEQCPTRVRNLWLASLVPMNGLILSIRQGLASAEPIRAQAEIREGVIFSYSQRFAAQPSLLPNSTPVPGAQPLLWTPPIDELDQQFLLVIALPVLLLVLLLVAMRIAYASTSHIVAETPPRAAVNKPANNAKRR